MPIAVKIIGYSSLYRGMETLESPLADLSAQKPWDWQSPIVVDSKIPWDPVCQLAAKTANLATEILQNKEDLGVFLGSSRGPATIHEQIFKDFQNGKRIPSWTSPASTFSCLSSYVAKSIKATGPSLTVSSACSTSLQSLGVAYSFLKSGLAKRALAGGAEAAPTTFTGSAFEATGACSKPSLEDPWPCLPGHEERNGMFAAEGSAALLLQVASVKAEGVYLRGFGSCTEHNGRTGVDPQGKGLAKAIQQSLNDAALLPQDIDLIVGHGTGTIKGDAAELRAYERIFDTVPPTRFFKWRTGHTLGAAGALATHQAVEILQTQNVPQMPYDRLIHRSLEITSQKPLKRALVTAMGFGGSCAVVIIEIVQ